MTEPAARRRPPGRYDEPSRATSRPVGVVLAVVAAALVGALVWTLFQRYGPDELALQVRGFDVPGDDRVVVEFEVTPPAGGTAWCLVRARDRAGLETGRQFVPVRGDGDPVRVQHALPTTGRAVSGEVPRCSTSAPPDDAPTAEPVGP